MITIDSDGAGMTLRLRWTVGHEPEDMAEYFRITMKVVSESCSAKTTRTLCFLWPPRLHCPDDVPAGS